MCCPLDQAPGGNAREAILTAAKKLTEKENSWEPDEYKELLSNQFGPWIEKEVLAGVRDTVEGLRLLRQAAMRAQCKPASGAKRARRAAARAAEMWVGFLIGEGSSSESRFLQRYRAKDTTFYRVDKTDGEPRPTLRPKPRSAWPEPWKGKLESLKSPQFLTVTELELALTIFDWDSGERARFVWWIQWKPEILWKVHRFLLKRYCFDLLDAFEEAAAQDGGRFDLPPYRAGERWRIHPRIWCLTGVGVLALSSLGHTLNFFFAAGWGNGVIALALGAAAFAVLRRLIRIDVYRQNMGVMSSDRHGTPRVQEVLRLFSRRGLALAGVAWFLWMLGDGTGGSLLKALVGVPSLASCGCLIGAILQWFWEDKAATEPM
jgi:hypothetical protein